MSDLCFRDTDNDTNIDDRVRGFPTGHAPVLLRNIGNFGWKPFDGEMALPLMSLNEAAFDANAVAMLGYAKSHGVQIAPHAKTPMSPVLAKRLVDKGAWGATVADMRQAAVLLRAGFRKLILGNEIGGPNSASRLARLLAQYPDTEMYVFVDSVALAESLLAVWRDQADLPKLGLLVELGVARAGARNPATAQLVVEAILSGECANITLAGIAAYEGAAGVPDPVETLARIDTLLSDAMVVYRFIRERIGLQRSLLLTAGGSLFFDRVVAAWASHLQIDGNLTIMLRSGAIFFHDHGVYERGIKQLDARRGFGETQASSAFRPALRLWAEVLSRPEPETVICGFGMRDVAIDQDFPKALTLYRNGQKYDVFADATVQKLNDQHAFIQCAADADVTIGDVIEFGISHPCTCLDRHSLIYGLDETATVINAYPTCFG
ncbi:alanine racemase [Ochrobactrum sp. CM-21-5]|nr:alanine racemase [Ochrobactrum sp. CM-21-5]MBC2887024.1 alanine racemase [Ochrobactrum sp. CM-21-5]